MEVLKTLNIIRITVFVMTWFTGIILNSSIVAVYFRDWKNSRYFSVCDKIFLSKALLNIVQQCLISINGIVIYVALYLLFAKKMYVLVFICNFSLVYGNFWYSAWLSIYYFLKLVKHSHRFFLQLKKTLSSSTVLILILTMLGMVFINLPSIWAIDQVFPQNETIIQSGDNYQIKINDLFGVLNLVCGGCFPFMATFVCIGFSVASLLSHVWRRQKNVSLNTSSPQTQGLLRAVRTMSLQLTINGVLYMAVIFVYQTPFASETILDLIQWTIIVSFPSAQAIILILGNPKLCDRLFCQAFQS
ncbi:taste receptor type 2 member 140-like [Hyperolius riggenbachi]|uniref:taste receptor type 2 member 140-like n=1 Tax=Hyperolius riggenbachi TaxID=752182 RepID=UPI0035A38B76